MNKSSFEIKQIGQKKGDDDLRQTIFQEKQIESNLLETNDRIINKAMQNQIINEDSLQNEKHLTEAYKDFKNRLCYKYLISQDSSDFKLLQKKMNMIQGNSTPCCNMILCCIPLCWCNTFFDVPQNQFAIVHQKNSEGEHTVLYGPGYHYIGFFSKLQGVYGFESQYNNDMIESEIGDLKIVRVNQGNIVNFECSGQNIILPPGIHMIKDPLIYISTISLDSFFIKIGPERWVTVPDGYDGISINRGKIKILHGGKQHHLEHVGEKFAKMIPKILQTDKVTTNITGYIEKIEQSQGDKIQKQQINKSDPSMYLHARTIEGALLFIDVMIFWNIIDTDLASKSALEILDSEEDYNDKNQQKAIQDAYYNISNLRTTVLELSKKHLTSLISTFSISSKTQREQMTANFDNYKDNVKNTFEILTILQNFDNQIKDDINKDLTKIGCFLSRVCIYSVQPVDEIQKEINEQTQARVYSKTLVINSQNNQQTQMIDLNTKNTIMIEKAKIDSRVLQMNSQAEGEAQILKANAKAEAIQTIAIARKQEAEELQAVEIACDLEKIRVVGEQGKKVFQGQSNNYVFGQNPGEVLFQMFEKRKNK